MQIPFVPLRRKTSAVRYNLSDNQTFSNWTVSYNDYRYIQIYSILTILFYSIIFLLGTVGNGLVIWIAGFKMKTVSAVWFLNLAVADFICCVSIPLQIFVSQYIYDLVITVLWFINMCTSVYFLTAMSIDRCVSIMWPFWSKTYRTPKCVCNISAIVWVVSIVLNSPHIIINYGYYFYHNEMDFSRFVAVFIVPFSVIVICYCVICFKLRKVKIPKRKQRPYKIITAVILCFLICIFPFHILPLLITDNYFMDNLVITISMWLIYFNSCINPILYVLIGQNIKDILIHSIPSRLERALND
ncbi:C3a anaphylatoxin chemotactic receptor-like [Pseudophryne corroboree]|uniref:C3a anaphylatoxin chemotactic receptor-like n=1 Tax=Pseudophryne corroboree TaxID=495146 RepID=UPI00308181C3